MNDNFFSCQPQNASITDSEKLLAARSSPPSIQAVDEDRKCVVDALLSNVSHTMQVRADLRRSILFSFLRIRVRRILSPPGPFDDQQPSSTPSSPPLPSPQPPHHVPSLQTGPTSALCLAVVALFLFFTTNSDLIPFPSASAPANY
ncbi:hypothetical protein PIB30_074910 [Stylosanthes scabra]|uniref:Uncharacterized protein n=1 Tax=Stylosanthes scabra TaxID=79078 RepID=A0ABU6VN80_9FABA|nr:hypothetical protein [Stylosanthes scabra]